MLESKKKMAQSFSDLKVALEKGRGSPEEFFSIFSQACQDFSRETMKVPPEMLKRFIDLVEQLDQKMKAGDESGIFDRMDELRALKKSCHEKYKK
jgi:XXXCH domain-containing protein